MAVSKIMRAKVLKRDNNQCWHCPEIEAISLQHRSNRQMGGSKTKDRLDNLIVLCSSMNLLIESNADAARRAQEFGWKLNSWQDYTEPVYNANEGVWYVIDVNGNKTPVDAPANLF